MSVCPSVRLSVCLSNKSKLSEYYYILTIKILILSELYICFVYKNIDSLRASSQIIIVRSLQRDRNTDRCAAASRADCLLGIMKRQAAWGTLARVFFHLMSALFSRVSRVAPCAPRSLVRILPSGNCRRSTVATAAAPTQMAHEALVISFTRRALQRHRRRQRRRRIF